ncbi:hypothetical protein CSKR_201518 [Clonorchis sinensis]|uniref:Uncharacterized protein n=1 Tax=Clonorchis sinensis TaxID=79923 RepID=A0A8T1MS89_CLOSI|nr:hypothetical protein CSKR_201518 [Clonorchis sinensis]
MITTRYRFLGRNIPECSSTQFIYLKQIIQFFLSNTSRFLHVIVDMKTKFLACSSSQLLRSLVSLTDEKNPRQLNSNECDGEVSSERAPLYMLCLVHATGGMCECEFYAHFSSPYTETVQCPLYVLSSHFSKLFLLSLHIGRVPRLLVCLFVCLFV